MTFLVQSRTYRFVFDNWASIFQSERRPIIGWWSIALRNPSVISDFNIWNEQKLSNKTKQRIVLINSVREILFIHIIYCIYQYQFTKGGNSNCAHGPDTCKDTNAFQRSLKIPVKVEIIPFFRSSLGKPSFANSPC